MLIVDDQDRTLGVPEMPSWAADTAYVYRLDLRDSGAHGSPPLLAIGDYNYQAEFDGSVAEGVLTIVPPDDTVDFVYRTGSSATIMLWASEDRDVEVAAFQWRESDCEGAWIAHGLAEFDVDDHWLRVDVTAPPIGTFCVRENADDSADCRVRFEAG